jgi:hypothetical protein
MHDSCIHVHCLLCHAQGSSLEKHKLQLQLSKHGAPGAAAAGAASKKAVAAKAAAAKAAGTKLVVRNVAFEATRKDLMGLFGPFGHIKSCRYANGVLCACGVVAHLLTCVHNGCVCM